MSNGLDLLSWIRIAWEWMKKPSQTWKGPANTLLNAPRAVACTDCKSMFDMVNKNTTPKCEEMRTALECLLIKERVNEHTMFRWMDTRAMISDVLTKPMEGTLLRDVLRLGLYKLIDEDLP